MGDSHTCTHGALCAFTAGVGTTELENGIITGLWVCPPQKVIRVNFIGTLPENVFAKDLILILINKIGVKGATNAVLEFGGEIVDRMSMEARMTLTNMAVEAGATSGMVMFDQVTADYLWPIYEIIGDEFTRRKSLVHNIGPSVNSDLGARYDDVIEIDVTDVVPVMTNGYSPQDVINVSDYQGVLRDKFKGKKEEVGMEISIYEKKPINQVYIGSFTLGGLESLRIAAHIFWLINAKVHKDIRCIVVPPTQHIYNQALKEGLIQMFVDAGCFISGPTCGACLGMSCGVLAPEEVCVSTTNRNFPGRMGKDGMVHLVSAATAAYTAIKGFVAEPSVILCKNVLDIVRAMPVPACVPNKDWDDVLEETPDYSKYLSLFGIGEVKDFSGKVFYLPHINVDTDQIIPAKYLTETVKKVFGQYCLEDAKISAEDRPNIFTSQVLVAGDNFGCGSSREHAPWALESAGIRCVIAPSFARIFENSMFANGLVCIKLPKNVIDDLFGKKPESVKIDWENGTVKYNADHCWDFKLTDYQKDLIKNGGSTIFMIKLAAELQKEGKL